MERRLAAILAADVVEYSRLMGNDEEGTLAALKACREIIDELVSGHHGRVFGSAGDSVIAEFASPVEAVRCSFNIQQAMTARNTDIAQDRQMQFRIGVNLGDVMADGGNLFGDGVNIAARLEQLAQPGGIAISEDIHRQIAGKIEAAFDDLGEQKLKNVAQPVRVFASTADGDTVSAPTVPGSNLSGSEKPAVAVLPFDNLSNDPEQEYFADGICEDIITELSRNADLIVIARNSTFAYKGKPVQISEVSEALGAQFVLEGSVRKAGRRVRITAQLIDANGDRHVWAERYDRDLDDIFAVQDEVVGSIVQALGSADGAIDKSMRQRSIETPSANPTAYDYYLQSRAHRYRPGDSGYAEAEALLEKAIDLDPGFARAYSALSGLLLSRFKLHSTVPFEDVQGAVLELAQKSVQLDPDDYRGHLSLGLLHIHQGQHGRGLAEYERAQLINPNDAQIMVLQAEALIYGGRAQDALEQMRQAIRLNPNCPDWYWWHMGSSNFHLGRYEDALAALDRISAPSVPPRRLKIATYAQSGRLEEARAEAAEFMKIVPAFSIKEWAKSEPYTDDKELQRFIDGLRMAGLPE